MTECNDSRLAALEARIAGLEAELGRAADHLAVVTLIAAYSPAVDSGDAEAVGALWTADGVYDVDTGRLEGRAGIEEMVRGPEHRGLIDHGCGHVPGVPRVELDGDRAVATGYSQLVVRSARPGRYSVVRVTANRWELERRAPVDSAYRGWRVVVRTARALTDDGEGRALLKRAADPSPG